MMPHPIAIQMTGISKTFGKHLAVVGLDLTVQQGELFSLLGPNGAGKTTTIKMLCCLLRPSSGTATIMGNDIQKAPLAVKQVIDISPQETALSEHLNAWENLSLIGRSHGLAKSTVRKRSEELLQMMSLLDRAKERVRRFSGGMKRRLSIAMALVSDPQVLFLDEPTLGLDPQSRAGLWEHIERLKGGKTVMLTTHYLEEADSLADRIAIMDEGRVVVQGTSRELKDGISERKVMRIEADGLSADVVEGLRQIYPEVAVVEGGVEITSDDVDLYAIQDYLRPRGVTVRSTYLKQATLDDVFLHYTGRELRE
ncbi:ATP-binding cassette domain-containing protein [Candidatus Bipolaricaulota bacterium]|nr:ATP-binding cassette domain-containing protein [Candidatus Bipolaricaulota bacterium]